ncbi:HNH endonuclease signature motif containing protein [Corynebacterium sp. H128]|uniref:HNH endonuclease signature motif containing protein n=1 Tax=Corynebacterium sp. H128 TaxID=3133427 RepID=UPI0030AEA1FF
MIATANKAIERELIDGTGFDSFGELLALKESIARLETEMARGREVYELVDAGLSRPTARRLELRASYLWSEGVSVEHQDLILSALEKLSGSSPRRQEIDDLGAAAALESTPQATYKYVKQLVRDENEALACDPGEAHRQRRFAMRQQDEHGGCLFNGYAPAATAALLQALLDQAYRADDNGKAEHRTVAQRSFDAFDMVVKWASSDRRIATGHASLVVSITEGDGFDWRANFATNAGIDLNLFDIDMLRDDRITDYIVVHERNGAIKTLVTAQRCANFHQRVSLIARDLVCHHPGCDVPASRCEANHVTAWNRGGATSIENLGFLCRDYHRRNDDNKIRRHMDMFGGVPWWVDDEGRARRNRSPAAQRAGARRVTDPE